MGQMRKTRINKWWRIDIAFIFKLCQGSIIENIVFGDLNCFIANPRQIMNYLKDIVTAGLMVNG